MCVGGDFVDLVVGEIVGAGFFGGGHNGDGAAQLLKLVGGGACQHTKLACAAVIGELAADHAAVVAADEAGDLFEVLVD